MHTTQIVKLYYRLTGGVDSGLAELNVLNYWLQHKVSGDRILADVSVDPKNHVHVQQAAHIFGSVCLGFQVQAKCLQEFDDHKPWTPGRLTKDGHAVLAVGYDQQGLAMLTWGSSQEGTWAWWDECVDEVYAIVPPEAKDPDFAPGFDVQQLLADLNDVADRSSRCCCLTSPVDTIRATVPCGRVCTPRRLLRSSRKNERSRKKNAVFVLREGPR
jgi:hypothetical protein